MQPTRFIRVSDMESCQLCQRDVDRWQPDTLCSGLLFAFLFDLPRQKSDESNRFTILPRRLIERSERGK